MNRYSKDTCLGMDWSNKKEIKTAELAYCIHTHKLEREIPADRLKAVTGELEKLQKQDAQQQERDCIEMILECNIVTSDGEETTDFYLDPTLFTTADEAMEAIGELNSCWNREMEKTEEYNHEYKNTDTYSRDYNAMLETMRKARDQYIKMGGSRSDIDTLLATLPEPTKATLKQDVDAHRERITQRFVSMGTSPTRASKIAIAITTEAYFSLK